MKNILKMAWMNVLLAYRIRIAFFFTTIMPMAFFFLYFGVFAKGVPNTVAELMGSLISLSVISSSLFGLSVQLVVMRERDMLRRYHLAPITASQMVFSRLLSNYLLFMPVVVLQFVLAAWIYHMPMTGSYLGLWIIYSLGYFAMGGIGLVVAGIVNTMQEAQVLNQILFLALLFLSGSAYPLSQMSRVLQHLALFLPPTLMVVASQGIILGGQGTAQHWPEVIGLALIAISCLGLSIALFRWEKEAKASRPARLRAMLALVPILVVGIWLNTSSSFLARNRDALGAMAAGSGNSSGSVQKIDPSQMPSH